MKVPVINKSTNRLPEYANPGDAGLDLRAELNAIQGKFLFNSELIYNIDGTIDGVRIHPGGRALIPTELYTEIPEGYEVQIRPRSGLALKSGITVLNSPGTIDSGYRNSWGVILANFGQDSYIVEQGDRIAQAVLTKYERIEWIDANSLAISARDKTGFGDSGTK